VVFVRHGFLRVKTLRAIKGTDFLPAKQGASSEVSIASWEGFAWWSCEGLFQEGNDWVVTGD
jgi:hypothetical protein